MFEILEKKPLHKTVTLMKISAPYIADKARPGQFVILKVVSNGERIPLTVADCDKTKGLITIIFQVVGATTKLLNSLNEGDCLSAVVGPLGKPSKLDGLKKVAVVGGGVGCAIAYPVAKYLSENSAIVHTIVGFKTKNLIILQDQFKKISSKFFLTTDDGSYAEKGVVTDILKRLLNSGERYDQVIAIGPLIMMKSVCNITKTYNIKTIVSMNPIMIDGTGMCGGCRVSVGGKIKFACVDGPDFDGHLIDFDVAIKRNRMYEDFEKKAYCNICNILKGVE